MSLAHRAAVDVDQNFIAKSWVASFRDADSAGCIQARDWYRVMIPTVNAIRAKPDVVSLVAYETDDPDPKTNAYGFIVADLVETPPLVYYVFVKQNYRRLGVARFLFAAAGIDPERPFNHVCSTPVVDTLQRKIPMARWTPRLGRFPKSERGERRP